MASVAAGADYGFLSCSEGCRTSSLAGRGADARFDGYGPLGSVVELGAQQFVRNLGTRRTIRS